MLDTHAARRNKKPVGLSLKCFCGWKNCIGLAHRHNLIFHFVAWLQTSEGMVFFICTKNWPDRWNQASCSNIFSVHWKKACWTHTENKELCASVRKQVCLYVHETACHALLLVAYNAEIVRYYEKASPALIIKVVLDSFCRNLLKKHCSLTSAGGIRSQLLRNHLIQCH